jgi:hypothetical protein
MSILASEAFQHVDPEIFKKFLELIRDKYLIVNEANYVLEDSGMGSINIAVPQSSDKVVIFLSRDEKWPIFTRRKRCG